MYALLHSQATTSIVVSGILYTVWFLISWEPQDNSGASSYNFSDIWIAAKEASSVLQQNRMFQYGGNILSQMLSFLISISVFWRS